MEDADVVDDAVQRVRGFIQGLGGVAGEELAGGLSDSFAVDVDFQLLVGIDQADDVGPALVMRWRWPGCRRCGRGIVACRL